MILTFSVEEFLKLHYMEPWLAQRLAACWECNSTCYASVIDSGNYHVQCTEQIILIPFIGRYENSDKFTRFTEDQLAEIRKVKLSKIICTNADQIPQIQRQAMDMPDPFL